MEVSVNVSRSAADGLSSAFELSQAPAPRSNPLFSERLVGSAS
jgi:hypothetical protein